jgi:Domain of unknown function (DUF4845)
MKNGQKGITFLSFIIVLAVIGFFLFIGMRLFPVYATYYNAVKDIKAMSQEQGAATRSIDEIRRELEDRFNISYVKGIDLKRDIKLVNSPTGKQIQLKYEMRRPLIYNLDFVAMFDQSFPLGGKAAIE